MLVFNSSWTTPKVEVEAAESILVKMLHHEPDYEMIWLHQLIEDCRK